MKIGVLYASTINLGSFITAVNFMHYAQKALKDTINYIVTVSDLDGSDTCRRFREELGDETIMFEVISPIPFYAHKMLNCLLAQFDKKCIIKIFPEKFLDADAIVALGGDIFTESYGGIDAVVELLSLHTFRRRFGKKVVLLSQTIGPFTSWREQFMLALLRGIDLITCRDSLSYSYLRRYGLCNVSLGSDLAFLPLPKENRSNLELERNCVVLAPSYLLCNYMRYASYEDYVDFWASLATDIIKMGYEVIIVPHACNHPYDDDRLIVRDIEIEIKKKFSKEIYKNVRIVHDLMLPHRIRNDVFSKAKVTITGRMHATISSIVMGAVPINLAYSEKSYGVISQDLGTEELVIDVRTLHSMEQLKKLTMNILVKILKSYDIYHRQIFKKRYTMQYRALKNISLFLKIIQSRN
jgi:colanic acid/amylovoran biosynthesis protein